MLSSLIRLALAIVIHNAGLPKSVTQGYGSLSPVLLISQLCRAILPTETQTWEVSRAAAQRAHNVAARLRSLRVAGESDEYGDLLQALEGKLLVETAAPAETLDFDALFQTLVPAPSAPLSGFPDPSFSWSNLDIWLSNLDSNGFQNSEGFDNSNSFQTDYT